MFLDAKGHPLPYTFIKTIDVNYLKILEFEDLLDLHRRDELYSIINKRIYEEVDVSIEAINEDVKITNSVDYYLECYEAIRNQEGFDFYIEDLNVPDVYEPKQ